MALINATAIPDAADYELEQGLRFDRSSLGHLDWTPSTASTRKKWTFSFWVKPSMISSSDSNPCIFNAQDTGTRPSDSMNFVTQAASNAFHIEAYNGSAYNYRLRTTQVFRDPSAWYHFVVAFDTTLSTASDRIKIYVNGERITSFSITTYPNQDLQTGFLNTVRHRFSNTSWTNDPSLGNQLSGYLAEVNMIDGQQLTPAHFGYSGAYGEWKPIEYSGTYGTNGFYLPFKQDYSVEGFSTVLYKCNNASQYIGGVGFKPDLVWIKQRIAGEHKLYDSVRGAYKSLSSDQTVAEDNYSDTLTAFNTDGFSLGADGTDGFVNFSGNNVAWSWDMGADTPTGFSAVTYTGTGATNDISGMGFSPDLVWLKCRDAVHDHQLSDTVRGAKKTLFAASTEAEYTGTTDVLTKFNPDGFTVGATGTGANENTKKFVAWGWDMGNTTATNTSGSISSQVRANPTYGQSIVSYTGSGSATTVGHGLSSAPEMILVKSRTDIQHWSVYHASAGNQYGFRLNETGAQIDYPYWNDTTPTSSVFSIGGNDFTNKSSSNFIAYCFHSVSGYSKFGSYSGSGGSGNAQTLGFRPAFLMVKRTDSTGDWAILDSTRAPLNPVNKAIRANSSVVEDSLSSNYQVTFTDTGFSFSNYGYNETGSTYIYAAFAGGMDSISDYNTDGSIDSRVKANTTYGQSIVTWTGNQTANASVGTGLSSAAEIIIIKNRETAGTNWRVHDNISGKTNGRMDLNGTGAENTTNHQITFQSDKWTFNSDSGTHEDWNKNNTNMLAYCFHSVSGYSKFGSYTGDGSSSKQITTGFKPAFVMIKNADTAYRWYMLDNTRDPSNPAYHRLFAEQSGAEATNSNILEFNDTGFKLITSDAEINQNGSTHIYMAFADKREYAYWLDQSGNNNDFTGYNLTESDISVDSPTNNFATMNPLTDVGDITLTEGNLVCTNTADSWPSVFSTMGMTSGKWYFEAYGTDVTRFAVGIAPKEFTTTSFDVQSGAYVAYSTNPLTLYNNASSASAINGTPAFVEGDILGFAIDIDAGKMWISINNTYVNDSGGDAGTPAAGNDPVMTFTAGTEMFVQATINRANIRFNFGQDSSFAGAKTAQGNQDGNDIGDFYYTPPTGFLALCTKNLPNVAVTPSEHFGVQLYSHTNADQTVTLDDASSLDMVWVKSRSAVQNHRLIDIIRGKSLSPNVTSSESNDAGSYAFSGNTFTIDNNAGDANENSATYVAWMWKANGSGSSNTNGSITSTVSANVDAGFSIVSFAGDGGVDTIGHGLSKAPEVMVLKNRNASDSNWIFWHKDFATNHNISLNLTNPSSANGQYFFGDGTNMTVPISTVFTVGNNSQVNNSGDNTIAYCFHSVDGYSKVGAYTGNGSTDGTFVYTGFRPAFVMRKRTDSSGSWRMHDSERNTYNVANLNMVAEDSQAEASSGNEFDMLSNGFKCRAINGDTNGSSASYIYIAFAETPFKNSNAR